MTSDFYQFSAPSLKGDTIPMSQYRGQVVLVVNTASKCGFTPQYAGLESLYQKYQKQGLVILGFPCNQFARQEPEDEGSIAAHCLLHYGVTFPMFAKIKVNGRNAHPLYRYLKQQLKGTIGSAIKWNFTKFLLDRNGRPVKRYSSMTTPEDIEPDIVQLLLTAPSQG